MTPGQIRKALVALAGVVAIVIGADAVELQKNTQQIVEGVLAILTVLGVYTVPNDG